MNLGREKRKTNSKRYEGWRGELMNIQFDTENRIRSIDQSINRSIDLFFKEI